MDLPHLSEEELVIMIQQHNLTITPLLGAALEQAKITHGDQVRDGGQSYLEQHIYPVTADVIASYGKETCPQEAFIGALLHDVLEDDEDMSDERFEQVFGKEIFQIVKSVTKPNPERKLTHEELRERTKKQFEKTKENGDIATRIKFADKANNMICSQNTHTAKFERFLADIKEIFIPAAKERNTYFYERLVNIVAALE